VLLVFLVLLEHKVLPVSKVNKEQQGLEYRVRQVSKVHRV
jgi:hypothetical protein